VGTRAAARDVLHDAHRNHSRGARRAGRSGCDANCIVVENCIIECAFERKALK
jgi:hypothetical protein